MAISATSFTITKRIPLGNSCYMVLGTYTGPASYTSGGEIITQAILQAGCNISQLLWGEISSGHHTDGTFTSKIVLDLTNITGTQQGKIHAYTGLRTHTHDLTVKGGLTSSEALFLDASQSFGKTAATDRTVVGSTSATTGGVKAVAGLSFSDELAGTTDLSGETYRFLFIGV